MFSVIFNKNPLESEFTTCLFLVPGRVEHWNRLPMEAAEVPSLGDAQNSAGQGPEQPELSLKLAQL